MKKFAILLSLGTLAFMSITAKAEVSELRVPLGAGGFGFLPLHIMKKYQLVEKKAAEAGLKLAVNWANVGGPSVMNDAVLCHHIRAFRCSGRSICTGNARGAARGCFDIPRSRKAAGRSEDGV